MKWCLFCQHSENLTKKGKATKYLGCNKKQIVLSVEGMQKECDLFEIIQDECVLCSNFMVDRMKVYYCKLMEKAVDGSGCPGNDEKLLDKGI